MPDDVFNEQQDVGCDSSYIAQETDKSEQGPSVTVSVSGQPHSMTVYEVSRIGVTEFAALWTVSFISAKV